VLEYDREDGERGGGVVDGAKRTVDCPLLTSCDAWYGIERALKQKEIASGSVGEGPGALAGGEKMRDGANMLLPKPEASHGG
jgi:hypothetical protein